MRVEVVSPFFLLPVPLELNMRPGDGAMVEDKKRIRFLAHRHERGRCWHASRQLLQPFEPRGASLSSPRPTAVLPAQALPSRTSGGLASTSAAR